MTKYLIDTHIVLWLLDKDTRLSADIREDIDYFQNPYFVSVESLREIVILQSLKKISLVRNMDKVISDLQERQIQIIPTELAAIRALEKMPILKINGRPHEDPFDRLLIAQAIAGNYTIVSADQKFPFYREIGLKLLANA